MFDGKMILETSKISTDDFNHGFYIEKNLVIIQEKGNDYDLRINSIWFAQLYGDVKPAGEFDEHTGTEYAKKKSMANVCKDKLHKTTGKSLRNYNEREEYETKARYDGQKYYQRDDKIENWSEIERKIHQVKCGQQPSEGKTEEPVKKNTSNENAFDNFENKFSNGNAPQLHKAQSESVKKSFDDFDFPQPVQRNFSQNQEVKQEVRQAKVETPTKSAHEQDFLSLDVPSDNASNQQVPSSNNVPSLIDFATVVQPGNNTFEVPTQKTASLADLYKQSSSMNEIPFNNQVPSQGQVQNNSSQPQSLNLDAKTTQPKSEPNKNDLWGSNLVNLSLEDITNKQNQGTHAYNKQSEFIHFNLPLQTQNNSNMNNMVNNFANMNMDPKQMNFNNNMGMMNNGMMNNMGMINQYQNQNQNWNMQNNNMGMMNMNMNNGGNFNNMNGMNAGRSYF